VLRKVVLPLLFPYIFSALKISYGVGWKVSLLVELFGAESGLGYLLEVARQRLDTPKVFGVIIVVIILVAAMERLVFTPIERRVLRHRAAVETPL
jgi:NitT/TauT family transport system permease protein/sulfonate transport system permease protein